jgi:hypothetical protein
MPYGARISLPGNTQDIAGNWWIIASASTRSFEQFVVRDLKRINAALRGHRWITFGEQRSKKRKFPEIPPVF